MALTITSSHPHILDHANEGAIGAILDLYNSGRKVDGAAGDGVSSLYKIVHIYCANV